MSDERDPETNGTVRLAFWLLGISLAAAGVIWLFMVLGGLIAFFPFGILGLVPLVGIGLLVWVVLRDQLKRNEDDPYSKNVDK